MRKTGLLAVSPSAAKFLDGGLLAQYRPRGFRTGQEHLALPFHHQGEVGQRRRVRCRTAALPQDGRDLRHHAACHHVAEQDVGIGAEGAQTAVMVPALSGVMDADERGAVLHGQIDDLDGLLREAFPRVAVGRVPVLREQVDIAPVDLAMTAHHTVDEHVQFNERARVEHREHALPCAQKVVLAASRRLLGAPFE